MAEALARDDIPWARVAHVGRHLNHAMMIGTGQVSKMVGIQLIESAVVASLAWVALRHGGMSAMLGTMGIIFLLLTGTFLPKRVYEALNASGGSGGK